MVRQTAKVVVLEFLAGFGLLVIVGVAALALRLASGPIGLDMFRDDVEDALVRARDGRLATVDALSLEWVRSERRAVIAASGISFFDTDRQQAASARRAEISIDLAALLVGDFEPQGIALQDGVIDVRQTAAGLVIAGDPVGQIGGASAWQAPEDSEAWLELFETGMRDLLGLLETEARATRLQSVSFRDFEVPVFAPNGRERLRFKAASGELERTSLGLEAWVSASSNELAGIPERLEARVAIDEAYSNLAVSFDLESWTLESLLDAVSVDSLSVTGVPLDLTASLGFSPAEGLRFVGLNFAIGSGEASIGDRRFAVEDISGAATYLPETDALSAEFMSLAAGPFDGAFVLGIDDVLRPEGQRTFRLSSPAAEVDLVPIFAVPWAVTRLEAEGDIDILARRIGLRSLTLKTGPADLRAQGEVEFLTDVAIGELPVRANLVAEMTGQLLAARLLDYWPVNEGPAARNFVDENVFAGTINDITAVINVDRDSRSQGYLDDKAMQVRFSATGVSVNPLDDLPPIVGADLVGEITGNSVRIDFTGGRFGLWSVGKGFVHYPQLKPAGADMMIAIEGRGPAGNLAGIVSDSRLQLEARSGFVPTNVTGDAEMRFELTRPALPDAPASAYRFTGEGQIRRGGLKRAVAGLNLTDSDARISLDETGISIAGFGDLAASPVRYDWRYDFGREGEPARLAATGVMTPDTLNAFGVAGRVYLSGDVPVDIDAALDGARPEQVNISFDLTDARLDVAELGWVKPAGAPAGATVRLEQSGDLATRLTAALEADDAALDGVLRLEPNGRLIDADLERAFVQDRFDLAGTAARDAEGGLVFDVSGPFLDLSAMMSNVSPLGGGTPAAARIGDVTLEADIALLRLREGFDIVDADLDLASTGTGLQTVEASGKTRTGAAFSAAYDASGLGDPAFRVASDDAGFMASVFLGLDALEDGELDMSGTLSRSSLPTQVRILITDGRLKDAPVFTQLLSLASIRGLSDTLSGEGVLFTQIDVPLTISKGRYDIVGARASGPALGMTASGFMEPDSGALDVSGVLVPSFGMNSALGGIPLIGDLFVSREGEGVFSLRYNVEGTLERAQVSVNPLSAITPGVLRRIFEDPASTSLDDLEDEAPSPAE